MNNEEKMVRAVTIDELAKRGKIIFDARTGQHVLTNENNIVNTEDEHDGKSSDLVDEEKKLLARVRKAWYDSRGK